LVAPGPPVLLGAAWLEAEILLVTNPDSTQHRYARVVGEELIALEPTRNPDCVAEADPLETALAVRQLKQ